MPPVSAVPPDLAVKVLKKYISYFTDELPPWSSEVWKKIEKDPDLNGKWTIGSIRTNVRENRRNILSEARKQCGISVNTNLSYKFNDANFNRDLSDVSYDDSEPEDYIDDDIHGNSGSDSEDNDIYERDNFTVEISREVWNQITNLEPLIYKGRKYIGFKPKVWTNKVAYAFYKQCHLKCAFVFKRGRITKKGRNYATMTGYCKAKNCKNPVTGIVKECPGDVGPVEIKMFCRDTRFVRHDDVKRPLNGTERLEVQEELLKKGANAWRKSKAKETIDPGDTGSPFVYDANTLHQAKKEAINKKLGIKFDDTRDMILTIRNMNVDPTYVNSILSIGDTPFYVFYATPTQFQAYSEYHRTHRQYSSICIDATGSLVKKLIDSKGDKSGYIFLYNIVINFNGTSVPVYQMLSEKHDANFISYWLSVWSDKVKLPNEAVSDGSKAILNAMSIAFNKKTLKEYINFCFETLSIDTNKRPNTFIRLDTAHFIHSVSKWECFQSALNLIVKTFFIRCMALIIECRYLKQLEDIFILMLIVANTEFEDSIIAVNDNCIITPLDARNHLETLISDRNIAVPTPDSSDTNSEEKCLLDKLSNCHIDKLGWSVALLTWVENLCRKSNTVIFTGSKLNSFYVRGLYDKLADKIKEFPIFTNICTLSTMSRATSCYVEADFKDLKLNLGKQVKLPTTVVKFLKLHISELLGGVCIFRAKINKFIVDYQFRDELNEREHEKWFENWKGLGKNTINKNNDWTNDESSLKEKNDQQEDSNIASIDSDCTNIDYAGFDITHDHDYSLRSINTENNLSSTEDSEIGNQETEEKNQHDNDDEKKIKPKNHSSSTQSSNDDILEVIGKINNNKLENKKETKYFQNYPEIKLQNNLVDEKTKKIFLLSNGNSSGIVSFNNQRWIVYNTCPFDTIVQLLFYGALENPGFHQLITQCDIPVFKFLIEFMSKGPTKNIYEKRLSILHPLYNATNDGKLHKIYDEQSKKIILCQTINCKDNVSTLWQKLLQDAPSLLERTVCSNSDCNSNTKLLAVLTVNHNIIVRHGFTALEKALNFYEKIFNIKCQNCQSGSQTRYNTPKEYIYIELDIRGSIKELSGRTCKLSDFPVNIFFKIQNEDKIYINLCYRLSGVAAYDMGHYFAYCRKLSGTWTKFNDLKSKPEVVSCSKKLQPHGVFYVLEEKLIA